jgi:hypothetical protein
VKFLGPEGSQLVGLEVALVEPGGGKIRDLADMQRQTGMRMKQIQQEAETNESFGLQLALFLTLRSAGHMVSFDTVGDFSEADLEILDEPGDEQEDEDEAEGPTSAPTASGRGDDVAPAPARKRSPSKRSSRGSATRSASGS